MADEELLVGAVVVVVVDGDVVDEMDDEDAVPVLPVDPVAPESAEPDVVVVDVGEEDVESVEARTALPPGRSWATTTPMTAVAPAAATIAPRVSVRTRD